jgi:hypothetical protein
MVRRCVGVFRAMRNLYAQELKLLGNHGITRSFFPPLAALESIAAPCYPISFIFLLKLELLSIWQEGLSPDGTFSRDRRAVGVAGEAEKFFSSVLHLIFIAQ